MLGITPSHLFVYYYTFLLYKTVFFSISLCTFPCQMESKVKSLKSVLSFFSAYFFFPLPLPGKCTGETNENSSK